MARAERSGVSRASGRCPKQAAGGAGASPKSTVPGGSAPASQGGGAWSRKKCSRIAPVTEQRVTSLGFPCERLGWTPPREVESVQEHACGPFVCPAVWMHEQHGGEPLGGRAAEQVIFLPSAPSAQYPDRTGFFLVGCSSFARFGETSINDVLTACSTRHHRARRRRPQKSRGSHDSAARGHPSVSSPTPDGAAAAATAQVTPGPTPSASPAPTRRSRSVYASRGRRAPSGWSRARVPCHRARG